MHIHWNVQRWIVKLVIIWNCVSDISGLGWKLVYTFSLYIFTQKEITFSNRLFFSLLFSSVAVLSWSSEFSDIGEFRHPFFFCYSWMFVLILFNPSELVLNTWVCTLHIYFWMCRFGPNLDDIYFPGKAVSKKSKL